MIIIRRLSQKKPLSSCRRLYLSASLSVSTSLSPLNYELKRPALGFYSRPDVSGFSSSSNKLNYSALKTHFYSSSAAAEQLFTGIVDVPLAQTGEGIAECELLKWFVHEGDQVDEFQPLCEVQSDKATIEITSRYKGKVSEILHFPGDLVKVGQTLLKMAVEDFHNPSVSSDEKLSAHGVDGASDPNFSLDKKRIGVTLCTPAVRNLAKQYGIDVNDVLGTGKDGRVLKEDVLKYAAGKGFEQDSSASNTANTVRKDASTEMDFSYASVQNLRYEDKTLLLRGFQRAMVKSMTMAAKVPHFHYIEEITCDALMELKASFQNENTDPNVKHTFLPFLVKSLSMALSKYPLLNSCFNEDQHEVIIKGAHNIGIAMATPSGLVVPNIKKVQSLSILEITKELSRLRQLAMDNKLNPDDVSGGTITVSNIGGIGGKFGSPLINLPEVAIIAIGRIQKVPRYADDGDVYPMSIMNVNIGADHRVLDGAAVAKFCNEWKLLIEKPELLILHMR